MQDSVVDNCSAASPSERQVQPVLAAGLWRPTRPARPRISGPLPDRVDVVVVGAGHLRTDRSAEAPRPRCQGAGRRGARPGGRPGAQPPPARRWRDRGGRCVRRADPGPDPPARRRARRQDVQGVRRGRERLHQERPALDVHRDRPAGPEHPARRRAAAGADQQHGGGDRCRRRRGATRRPPSGTRSRSRTGWRSRPCRRHRLAAQVLLPAELGLRRGQRLGAVPGVVHRDRRQRGQRRHLRALVEHGGRRAGLPLQAGVAGGADPDGARARRPGRPPGPGAPDRPAGRLGARAHRPRDRPRQAGDRRVPAAAGARHRLARRSCRRAAATCSRTCRWAT